MTSYQHLFFLFSILLFVSINEVSAQGDKTNYEYSGAEINFSSSPEEEEESTTKEEETKESISVEEKKEIKQEPPITQPATTGARDSEYATTPLPVDMNIREDIYIGGPFSKETGSSEKGAKIYEDDGIEQFEYEQKDEQAEKEQLTKQVADPTPVINKTEASSVKTANNDSDSGNKRIASPSPYKPITFDSPEKIDYGVSESIDADDNSGEVTKKPASIPTTTIPIATTIPIVESKPEVKKIVGTIGPAIYPPNTEIPLTRPTKINSKISIGRTAPIIIKQPQPTLPKKYVGNVGPTVPVSNNSSVLNNRTTSRSSNSIPQSTSLNSGNLYSPRVEENVIKSSKIIADDHGVYPNDPSIIPSFTDDVYARRIANLPTLVPMEYNKHVRRFINMFTIEKRGQVEEMLAKTDIYLPVFEEALLRHGLPLELKYLPIIESALMPHSTSDDGGVGLWQLSYGTAKLYGLEANSYIDERRDPKLSTEVAVKHLKTLYKKYKDWYLVIAAYNCGEGTLNKAIKRSGGNTNYWNLLQFLPKETRAYVPLFIASTYLMHHYKDHNIYKKEAPYSFYVTDTVKVKNSIDLNSVAQFINISIDELLFLNPALMKNVVPASRKGYPLVLPISKIPIFEVYLSNRRSNKSAIIHMEDVNATELDPNSAWNLVGGDYDIDPSKKESKVHYVKQLKTIKHVVGPDETLEDIAIFYDSKVEELMDLNNLHSRNVKMGRSLNVLVPEDLEKIYLNIQARRDGVLTDTEKVELEKAKLELKNKKQNSPNSYLWHSIKKEDSFKSISKRYKVSIESITRLNGFKGLQSELVPGRSIRVPNVR